MIQLAQPPRKDDRVFDDWMYRLWKRVSSTGGFGWSLIDKTGSNLTDLETRNHADLQNINTASYTHLTATQATDLTDSGATTLHKHDHNSQDGLQGGTASEYYHLTAADVTRLSNTSGTNTGDQTSVTGNSGTATAALGLKTATTTVAIDSATAPTVGQVLTAINSTSASWQNAGASSAYPGIYVNIQSADTYTIYANYQAIVEGTYTVLGTLNVFGDLRINNG